MLTMSGAIPPLSQCVFVEWYLIKQEGGLLMSTVTVIKRAFGSEKEELAKKFREDCIKRSFVTCTLRQILLG
jgi:hypothetical protein